MSSPFFLNLLNEVIQETGINNEMVTAKQEFEQVAGQIMETDHSYDARINAFHNWYILDRVMPLKGMTPLEYFIKTKAKSLPEEMLAGYKELTENLHSIFEMVKFGKEVSVIKDLLKGKKYQVEGTEHFESVDRGEIFNSRLFKHGRTYHMANYLILHPHSVEKKIKGEIKKLRKSQADPKPFLFRLLFFHSRWEQFSQMDVHNIYRFEADNNAGKSV